MVAKYIELDGNINGIVAKNMETNKFIQDDNKTKLFPNFEIAELILNSNKKNSKIRFSFKISNLIIPLDNCTKVGKYYQYIDSLNNIIYYIYELKNAKLISAGYFVFENGDTIRCDKEYGVIKVKKLMKLMKNISVDIMRQNKGIYGLTGVKERNLNFGSKEYILHLKKSSGRIHILAVKNIMSLNQIRKEKEMKAIPFIKTVDKYTCIYVYTTKLVNEPENFNTDSILEEVINNIIKELVDINDSNISPKYLPISFKCSIDDIKEV